jgi:hypothetical protein
LEVRERRLRRKGRSSVHQARGRDRGSGRGSKEALRVGMFGGWDDQPAVDKAGKRA